MKKYIANEETDISSYSTRRKPGSNKKRGRSSFKNKKLIIPIILGSVVLVAAVVLSFLLLNRDVPTDKGSTDNTHTSSQESFADKLKKVDLNTVNIDDKSLPFIKGIKVSGEDLGNMTYDEAYSFIESNHLKLVDKLSFVLDCEGKKNTLTQEDFAYNVDVAATLKEAYAISTLARKEKLNTLSEPAEVKLKYELDENSVYSAVSKVAETVNDVATGFDLVSFDPDASEGSQFVFSGIGQGKTLDVDDATKKLTELIRKNEKEGTVVCKKIVSGTSESASDIGSKMRLLSTYSTYSTNSYNGNHNMALSLSAVNGTVLNKGDTFSFNGSTGDSNLESLGYLPAGVIMNNQSAIGIGGGICQSATTIYNAALRAGLTIVERYPHAWPSTYVPQGLDATIDYPNLDLKFTNETDTPIYIQCYMSGTQLTCNIYGVPSDEWDEITCDSWATGSDSSGYSVAASRTYWKNGKEVRTESLKSSHYSYRSSGDSSSSNNSSSSKTSSKKSSKPSSSTPESSDEPESLSPDSSFSSEFPSIPDDTSSIFESEPSDEPSTIEPEPDSEPIDIDPTDSTVP